MSTIPNQITWQNFPEFYNNPAIQSIAGNERWTVSTTQSPDPTEKTKKPIDMYVLMNEQRVQGAMYNDHNPLVTLQTVCDVIPNATNNAYYLDALVDNLVVLDIEPKCPDNIKRQFLMLPYLYAETSMSGYGLHLIFNLPGHILDKYPNARDKMALKEANGYYEILLNHMVTFTRNNLPPSTCELTLEDFEKIFEELAAEAKPSKKNDHAIIEEIDTDEIPYFDEILDKLLPQKYAKTINDFPQKGNKAGFDNSAFEFGISNFYNRALRRLLIEGRYKDHVLTDEEKAIIVYKCVSETIEYRPKHDEKRSGMPWLLFVATSLIAKSDT